MINQEIYSRYISKGHTRRPETPETIVFDDHYFKFDYYTLKGISYICQYGINRHCKNRCNARILVPYSIHSEENWEEKVQLSDNHSNHPIINTAKPPFFSESQISKEIENIYLSNTPRYSRFKTFNLLLNTVKKLKHILEHFSFKYLFKCLYLSKLSITEQVYQKIPSFSNFIYC